MLPGAGDELQGIKKGVLELADLLAVNKADADPAATRAAVRDYTAALRLLTPTTPTWNPPVHAISGLTGEGLTELWNQVEFHRSKLESTGEFATRRSDQQVRWMWSMVDDRVRTLLRSRSDLAPITSELGEAVRSGSIPATVAADRLFAAFIDTDQRD